MQEKMVPDKAESMAGLEGKMDADKRETKAMQDKRDSRISEMMSKMDKVSDSQEEMRAHHEEIMASLERLNATANAWLEKTETCLEKKEPTPGDRGRSGAPGSPRGSDGGGDDRSSQGPI
jgi:vacuolar-type H+-ATPase subunit D/Vma8